MFIGDNFIINSIKNIVDEVENDILTFNGNLFNSVNIDNFTSYVTFGTEDTDIISEFLLDDYLYQNEEESKKFHMNCNSVDPLHDLVEKISTKLLFIFELLKLNDITINFKNQLSNLIKDNISSYIYETITGEINNKVLTYFLGYTNLLKTLFINDSDNVNSFLLEKLENILSETSYIINTFNIQPECEKDVKDYVYKVLRLFFPDIMREIQIPGFPKSYYVDLAIKSLRTGIEYKYANEEKEVKKFLDEIYTDVHGYSNSVDLKNFIGVLYMTGPYITKEVIMLEFKKNKINNWKIIIVEGFGERK